jgi:hypothetical protein
MSLSPRRTAFALAIFSAVPLLVACPKDKPAPVDAALPPPPPEEDASQGLVEMVEDAGPDIDADAAKPKFTGTGVSTNVLRLKQCCNQLNAEAGRMGSSPEAAMVKSAAVQCNTLATQVGPGGNAPELNVLRGLLVGRTLPPACAGF